MKQQIICGMTNIFGSQIGYRVGFRLWTVRKPTNSHPPRAATTHMVGLAEFGMNVSDRYVEPLKCVSPVFHDAFGYGQLHRALIPALPERTFVEVLFRVRCRYVVRVAKTLRDRHLRAVGLLGAAVEGLCLQRLGHTGCEWRDSSGGKLLNIVFYPTYSYNAA